MSSFFGTGFLIGFLVKFAGYTAFLQYSFRGNGLKSPLVALAKVLMGAGGAYLIMTAALGIPHSNTPGAYAALVLLRSIEWLLILKFIYPEQTHDRLLYWILVAILVSSLLDIPVLVGWISTEGLI